MLRTNAATSSGAPSRNCLRTASPASPNSDWYCSLGIKSIHARRCSPPGCEHLRAWIDLMPNELSAVLHLDDVPAGSDELSAPLVDADAGHNPVERLAVEVDKPHN